MLITSLSVFGEFIVRRTEALEASEASEVVTSMAAGISGLGNATTASEEFAINSDFLGLPLPLAAGGVAGIGLVFDLLSFAFAAAVSTIAGDLDLLFEQLFLGDFEDGVVTFFVLLVDID